MSMHIDFILLKYFSFFSFAVFFSRWSGKEKLKKHKYSDKEEWNFEDIRAPEAALHTSVLCLINTQDFCVESAMNNSRLKINRIISLFSTLSIESHQRKSIASIGENSPFNDRSASVNVSLPLSLCGLAFNLDACDHGRGYWKTDNGWHTSSYRQAQIVIARYNAPFLEEWKARLFVRGFEVSFSFVFNSGRACHWPVPVNSPCTGWESWIWRVC